jgi:hypothetical protein
LIKVDANTERSTNTETKATANEKTNSDQKSELTAIKADYKTLNEAILNYKGYFDNHLNNKDIHGGGGASSDEVVELKKTMDEEQTKIKRNSDNIKVLLD